MTIKIIVEVLGGVVINIFSDDKLVGAEVIDWDNIKENQSPEMVERLERAVKAETESMHEIY